MEENFIELKKPEEKLKTKLLQLLLGMFCHYLRDEVGGLEMVGSADGAGDSTVGLEKSDDVPKLGLCMEVFETEFDLHNEENKQKRQDEECEENHHKEQLEEFGGHGHGGGHCCGHCVVTVVVKY